MYQQFEFPWFKITLYGFHSHSFGLGVGPDFGLPEGTEGFGLRKFQEEVNKKKRRHRKGEKCYESQLKSIVPTTKQYFHQTRSQTISYSCSSSPHRQNPQQYWVGTHENIRKGQSSVHSKRNYVTDVSIDLNISSLWLLYYNALLADSRFSPEN